MFFECLNGNSTGLLTVASNVQLDDEGGSLQFDVDGFDTSNITSDSFIFSVTSVYTTTGSNSYTSNIQFSWNANTRKVTITWGTLTGSSIITGKILCITKGIPADIVPIQKYEILQEGHYTPSPYRNDTIYLTYDDDSHTFLKFVQQGTHVIVNNPDYSDYVVWWENVTLLAQSFQMEDSYQEFLYTDVKNRDWRIEFKLSKIYDYYDMENFYGTLFHMDINDGNFNLTINLDGYSDSMTIYCGLIGNSIDVSNAVGDDIIISKDNGGLTVTTSNDSTTVPFEEPWTDESEVGDDYFYAYYFGYSGDYPAGFLEYFGFKYLTT